MARPRLGTIWEEDENVSYVSELYQMHSQRLRRSISKTELIESLRGASGKLERHEVSSKQARKYAKSKSNVKSGVEIRENKNKSLLKRFVSFMTVPRAETVYS